MDFYDIVFYLMLIFAGVTFAIYTFGVVKAISKIRVNKESLIISFKRFLIQFVIYSVILGGLIFWVYTLERDNKQDDYVVLTKANCSKNIMNNSLLSVENRGDTTYVEGIVTMIYRFPVTENKNEKDIYNQVENDVKLFVIKHTRNEFNYEIVLKDKNIEKDRVSVGKYDEYKFETRFYFEEDIKFKYYLEFIQDDKLEQLGYTCTIVD